MSFVTIPLDKIRKIDFMVLPDNQRKTIKEMFAYLSPKPDYIINATFYNMDNGETIVHSEDENKAYGYVWSNEGIGISGDRDLLWCDKKTAYGSATIRDFIGGCPTLVKDGVKFVDSGATASDYILNGSHYRSFFGYNDSNLYIGYTTTKCTVSQEVQECLNSKLTHAVNLDGGGSVSVGKNENGVLSVIAAPSGYRANASWLLVYLNKDSAGNVVSVSRTPIKVKGTEYTFNAVLDSGKTLIQLRELKQAGFTIGYSNGCATLNRPGLALSGTPDKTKGNIMIDNKMYTCEMKLINDTNFMHIRQLEQAGYIVGYDTMASLDW